MKAVIYTTFETDQTRVNLQSLGTAIRVPPAHKKRAFMTRVQIDRSPMTVDKAKLFVTSRLKKMRINSVQPVILDVKLTEEFSIFHFLVVDHG